MCYSDETIVRILKTKVLSVYTDKSYNLFIQGKTLANLAYASALTDQICPEIHRLVIYMQFVFIHVWQIFSTNTSMSWLFSHLQRKVFFSSSFQLRQTLKTEFVLSPTAEMNHATDSERSKIVCLIQHGWTAAIPLQMPLSFTFQWQANMSLGELSRLVTVLIATGYFFSNQNWFLKEKDTSSSILTPLVLSL